MSNPTNIAASAKRYVESHQTGAQTWPDMAEYAVKFCYPVPDGQEKLAQIEFFLNREDLDVWIKETGDAENGNPVLAYQCYQWDLGPNPMPGMSWMAGQLPLTAAEKAA